MARTVFLTGATGFIGGRLAARLAARGDALTCYVREGSRAQALESLGARILRGELDDAAALTAAMSGADLAFHLAAAYDVGVVDAAAMRRTNVDGTAAFLHAVAASAVPKAIHVSTTAALPPAPKGQLEGGIERESPGPYPSVYHRTKAEAHRLAREAQERGLPLVIVCPAYVYGPGDQGPGGRFLEDLLRGRVPALVMEDAWFSFVHVDDVVDGLVRAGDHAAPGGVYVLAGEHRRINEFAAQAAAAAGRRAPRLRFPAVLAGMTGAALDAVSRATGVRFPLSRESVAVASRARWLHSAERARRELGWHARSLAEGLPETVAWHLARIRKRA